MNVYMGVGKYKKICQRNACQSHSNLLHGSGKTNSKLELNGPHPYRP